MEFTDISDFSTLGFGIFCVVPYFSFVSDVFVEEEADVFIVDISFVSTVPAEVV